MGGKQFGWMIRKANFLEVFVIKKKIRQKTMQKTIRAVKIIL